VLLAVAVAWLAVNVSPRWYPTPDSAGYLSVARELADTGRLRNLDSPHIYYPVGYPVLLAPAFLVADEPFLLISVMHFALALALLMLVYRWVREFFPEHAAWVTLLTVANTSFGHIYRRTLGETAFMVAWMLAGAGFHRLLRDGRGHHAAAVALIPLVLIRPAGAMLAGGLVVCLALAAWRKERSWRTAFLSALVVVPAAAAQLAWMTRDRLAAEALGNPTYSEQLRDPTFTVGGQLVEGLRLRIQEAGRLLMPGMFRSYAGRGKWLDVNMLVFAPITVALLIGWWAAVRRHRDVHLWALPFYVGLYISWPHDQTTRFFTPILPMLLVCLLTVVRQYPSEKVRRAGIVFAALHLGVALGFWLLDERRKNDRLMARLPELRRIVATIPPDERGLVAISSACGDEHPLLSFHLNRVVRSWSATDAGELPASVRWLVTRDGDTPPPGFTPALPPRLWHR
jgi:hypothetical protein